MKKQGCLFAVLLIIASCTDTIYFGGTILTMAGTQPQYVDCVLVRDGKIIKTGHMNICNTNKDPGNTTSINLHGKFMMPGFMDPHSHPSLSSIFSAGINLGSSPDGTVNSKQDAINLMISGLNGATYTETLDVFGSYLGVKYDNINWGTAQPPPDRTDLDQISTTVPVVWIHVSSYHLVLNTAALTFYGFSDSVTDPVGGRYYRDSLGSLTGLFEGNAATLFLLIKILPRLTSSFLENHYGSVQQTYLKFGYTSLADARTDGSSLNFFIGMAVQNKLKLDVYLVPDYLSALRNKPNTAPFRAFIQPVYINRLRVGGGKLGLDGSLQMKTAWLTIPYYVVPDGLDSSYKSTALLPSTLVTAAMTDIMNMGLQIHVHCNGDAALDQMLASVRSISSGDVVPGITASPFNFTNLDNRRIVALHATTARVDQLDTMINLKVIPSFYAMNLFYWGDYHKASSVGPDRAEHLSPAESAFNKNMLFSQHHDHPVGVNNPLRIVRTAVSRLTKSNAVIGAAEGINVYTALLSVTRWVAYNLMEDSYKGSIQEGLNADLIVLSEDPLTKAIEDIESIEVLKTIKDGVVLYEKQ